MRTKFDIYVLLGTVNFSNKPGQWQHTDYCCIYSTKICHLPWFPYYNCQFWEM